MHVAVFIENGAGEEVEIIDAYASTDSEWEALETILGQAWVLEKAVKKYVESKAEGEKSGE